MSDGGATGWPVTGRGAPTVLLDGDGLVRFVRDDAPDLAGHDLARLRGTSLLELVHPLDLATVLDDFTAAREQQQRAVIERRARVRGPDGAYRDVALAFRGLTGRGEIVATCRDITAGTMAEEALRAGTLHAALLEHTRALLAVFDADGTMRYCNPSSLDLLGLPPTRGLDLEAVLGAVHPDDTDTLRRRFATVATTPRGRASCTIRIHHPDGWRCLDVELHNRGDDPAIGGVVADGVDVTNRGVLEAELVARALHDPLTGLANRVLLRDRLTHALARLQRGATPLMVAYLDLDDFKVVNDTAGHAAGDAVLATVAARLAQCVRPGDTVARIGGDEFVVVCPDVAHRRAADELARRLLAAVADPVEADGHAHHVGLSIGMVLTDRAASADDVLRAADAAMYHAKTAGGSRVVVAPPAGG